MKTFRQFINEETSEQKFARLRADAAKLRDTNSAKIDAGFEKVQRDLNKLDAQNPKKPAETKVVTRPELPTAAVKKPKSLPDDDIFSGSRHSDGKTVQVSNQQTVVTPDKPMVGKDDAVRKLLKQKGLETRSIYHPDHEIAKREYGITSSNKIQDRVPQEQPAPNKPAAAEPAKVQRPFPDKAPEKQFGQDTKMKLLKLNSRIDSNTAKVNKPEPKVGSLAVKQSGYPAAKKPNLSLAPAESQRAPSPPTYKIQPGDNPTKIAKNLGISLQDLEKKNPGILKRAKRLKIGGTINR